MVYCCAVDCVNDSSKQKSDYEKVSFYRFPNDKNIQKLWLDKIRRPKVNLPPYKNIRLCHLHFENDCFERDLKNELLNLPTKTILKKNAVSTIFSYVKKCQKRNTMVVHKVDNIPQSSYEIESTVPTASFENQIIDSNTCTEEQVYEDTSINVFSWHVGTQHQVQLIDNSTQTKS